MKTIDNKGIEQKYTSKSTSINGSKLPAIAKKVDWSMFQGLKVLDIGCGRYSNLEEYFKSVGIRYFGYDKYWKTAQENDLALNCSPDIVISSNVLNVIDSNDVVMQVSSLIESYNVPFFVTIYEGNKTGIGKPSKMDCFQRNEPIKSYQKYFSSNTSVKNGVITNKVNLI